MLAASLFDSWIELMENYYPLIGILIITQLWLTICLFWIYKHNSINVYIGTLLNRLPNSIALRLIIWGLLAIFIVSPYLSFISTSLFLYGYVFILLLVIICTILLCIRKVREACICNNRFYYLMHFAIEQIIGYSIYIIVYKVRFWEMYSFPKDEEQLLLREIYPELGVLRRCCDDFIAILCLMAIPYMILGIYSCVKYLVRRLKLLWH